MRHTFCSIYPEIEPAPKGRFEIALLIGPLGPRITPILDGYQLFHNYMRPHMALDGKTPAEMCGIEIGGDNKWKTIIENASKDL